MNTHIDTLNEWYENAEQITRENMPRDGDTIMYPRAGGAYTIEPATYGWVESIVHPDDDVRILHRAPKPKPAWHNAVAVIASTRFTERQVYARYTGTWCGTAGDEADSEDLTDVVPLIEAKVTGDMIDRIEHHFISTQGAALPVGFARRLLHIALNLDPA